MRKKYADINDLIQKVDEWKEWIVKQTVQVEVPKPDKFGGCIVQTKPEPVIIESFCLYIGVSHRIFLEWLHAKDEYGTVAHDIKDFCNTHTLRNGFLGYATDKMSMFYLVNNSRYKDVSEIVHETTTKELPAWMQGAKIEITDKETKALPHESIPYVEIKETPAPIEVPPNWL